MSAPQQKASELVSRGLEHYGAGRLLEAMSEWEEALTLTPDDEQARRYLDYVRDHFDELRTEFETHGSLNVERVESGTTPLFGGKSRDLDDGWSMGDEAPTSPGMFRRADTEPESSRATARIGSGMLGDLVELGLAEAGDGAGVEAGKGADADAGAEDDLLELAPVDHSLGDLAGGDEPTAPVEPAKPGDYDFSDVQLGPSDQEDTVQRRSPFGVSELTIGEQADEEHEAEPEPATLQRPGFIDFSDLGLAGDESLASSEAETVQRRNPIDFPPPLTDEPDLAAEGRAATSEEAPALELREPEVPLSKKKGAKFLAEPPPTVDIRPPTRPPQDDEPSDGSRATTEVKLRGAGGEIMTPMQAMRLDVSKAADQGARADESHEQRVKRRVGRLIERAIAEKDDGRGQLAVVAANLALDEDPSSVVAQKLLHSHRKDLEEVFVTYLGNLEQVPVLARPLSELGSGIDSRDAFLLTRVDGLLSLSDIVDVSGMQSLDAHRVLCRLLIDGIILLG